MSTTEPTYTTLTGSICSDVPSCLFLSWTATTTNTAFAVNYQANVSIPLDQYGNIDSVNFNLAYNIEWASSKVSQGTSISTHSSVGIGGVSFMDNTSADDYNALTRTRNTWISSPFGHSGSVTPERYGDAKSGYVTLYIGITMPVEAGANIAYYVKGITFEVTNPIVNAPSSGSTTVTSTASSTSGVSQSGSSTGSSTRLHSELGALPGLSSGTSPLSSGGASVGSGGSAASGVAPPKTAIIAGVVGSLLGAIALVVVIWFIRRRRQKRNDGASVVPFTSVQDDVYSTTELPTSRRDNKPVILDIKLAGGREKTGRSSMDGSQVASSSSIRRRQQQSSNAALAQSSDPSRGGGELSPQGIFSPLDEHATRLGVHYPSRGEKLGVHRDETSELVASTSRAPPRRRPELDQEENLERPAPSTVMSPVGDLPPPPYFMTTSAGARLGLVGHSSSRPETLEELARRYRPLIPVELEAKLRRANYLPTENPDDIPEEAWLREYGVGPLELARVRRLYQMNVPAEV